MKIATFGSCLAKRTAEQYMKMFGGELIGSVYHNRSDRFVKTVIKREVPGLKLADFSDHSFEGAGGQIGKAMVLNQVEDGTLGKHDLPDQIGFMEAIKQPIDLILLDNYIDIVGKHSHFPENPAAEIFVIPRYMGVLADRMVRDDDYLPIPEALSNWKVIIDWIRNQQRPAKIFFLNFPMQQHPNTVFDERSKEFASTFSTTRIKALPAIEAHPILVESNTHFTTPYYRMLAALVRQHEKKR